MREPRIDWFWVLLAGFNLVLALVGLYQRDIEEFLDCLFIAVLIIMYAGTKFELDELRYRVYRLMGPR